MKVWLCLCINIIFKISEFVNSFLNLAAFGLSEDLVEDCNQFYCRKKIQVQQRIAGGLIFRGKDKRRKRCKIFREVFIMAITWLSYKRVCMLLYLKASF